MRTNINHRPASFYWNQVKDLAPEVKLDLISRLSQSIMIGIGVQDKETNLNECFGAWKTPEDVYSDEMFSRDLESVCGKDSDFIKEFL